MLKRFEILKIHLPINLSSQISPQDSMSQEGRNLPQGIDGISLGEAGLATSSSISASPKETEIINVGSKPISPVISMPKESEGIYDGATSVSDSMATVVGLVGTTTSDSRSASIKLAGSISNSNSVKVADEAIESNSKPTSSIVDHANKNKIWSNSTSPVEVYAIEKNYTESNPSSPIVDLDAPKSQKGKEKDELTKVEGLDGDNVAGNRGGTSRSSSKLMKSSSNGDIQDEVKDAPKPIATIGHDGGSSSKGKVKGKGKGHMVEMDHVVHIWTERERRKKMKSMYNTLHSLLPRLLDKADNATIVGETVKYIKTLEGTIQRLEKLKMERICAQKNSANSSNMTPAPPSMCHGSLVPATREATLADMVQNWSAQQAATTGSTAAPPHEPFQTWSASNIALSVTGNKAFITVSVPRNPCVLTKVLYVLEKYRIDVVTMEISSDLQNQKVFYIHTSIDASSTRLAENMMMTAEDKYKMAVAEMLQLISN